MEFDPRAQTNQDLFRRWRDARREWDTEARKDIDFYLGNNFTDDEWNNLYRLSEETFVEESDSLKEGAAGAGLTDND